MRASRRPWLYSRRGLVSDALAAVCVASSVCAGETGENSNTQAAREQFFRAERPAAAGGELLFVPRRQETKRGPAARLAGGDPQRGRVRTGGRARQARGEPARRGDQLRGPRDAPERQARPGESRHPHPLDLPGRSLASRDRAAHAPTATSRSARDRSSLLPTALSGRSNRVRKPTFPTVLPGTRESGPPGRESRSTISSSRLSSTMV